MENLGLWGFLIITLNCNVTFLGKVWLVFTLLFRLLVVALAGFPIYQDEQERFVCNTLQPSCTNICFDFFSPVSYLRFWLIQSVGVLLPSAVFSVYVLHRGARLTALGAADPGRCPSRRPGWPARVPDLSRTYAGHLGLRVLVEAAFGVLHYLLFGFSVPKAISCSRWPCSSAVDCYVSRPTEKFVLMLFLCVVSVLCVLLTIADLVCSLCRGTSKRPGPGAGAQGSLFRKEGAAPTWAPGRSQGQVAPDGGWQEEAVPIFPGLWTRGQGANSPRPKSRASGLLELPGEDESEVMSTASNRLATVRKEPWDSPHREVTEDARSRSPTRLGEQPSASQSHGTELCPASQPQSSGQLATVGCAPHLAAQKSQWV